MNLVTTLLGFGLRQVLGESAVDVVQAVEQRFRDHSQTLPNAVTRAHDRAWQALAIALAGDGFLDRVRVFFASGDDKGVREQVRQFLQANPAAFGAAPAQFRQDCLDELKRLRKSGVLSCKELPAQEVGRQTAAFRRYTDPLALVEGARQAVGRVADALAEGYPNLARLLRTPTEAGLPLLTAAFCYFFRREVETDEELAHGLFLDGLRQLTAAQARGFGEVNKALTTLGSQFDAVFEQLGRIEAAVVETHETVLDLQAELQRLGGLHLANVEEVRSLLVQVQHHLSQVGMQRGEVRPQHSFSIRGEEERRAIKALLARFRQLPPTEQEMVPALLNGLGKLQVGAGDFGGAKDTFAAVASIARDDSAKAEAYHNAYRAALEEKKWDAALEAVRQAAGLDPGRFAPFPLHRYEPKRLLGAGGFGTAFLCHDHHFAEDVVVKALHTGCLARGVDELFREARVLWRLKHPAIIGVRDCEYADPIHKARPYLVMDHFPGTTLQQFVDQRGVLRLEQLLVAAAQVAEAMQAAHALGVLHRDLKPANILVRKEGDLWRVRVIDFGLALAQQAVETSRAHAGATQKSMLEWTVAGTLDYAPPEQLGKLPGVQPGPYSDVYAFARTCCYAMFKLTELRRSQWNSLPVPLADLLEQCLNPDPQQRPQGFEPVLTVLSQATRKGEQLRLREQEERLRREQEDEQQRQREGEEQLRQLVRAALDRTGGKPTDNDRAQARDLCRRYKLSNERANAVVRQVIDEWRREREKQGQAPCPPVKAGGNGSRRSIPEILKVATPGVEIREDGDPSTLDCQVPDSKEGSRGMVEGPDVLDNKLAGVGCLPAAGEREDAACPACSRLMPIPAGVSDGTMLCCAACGRWFPYRDHATGPAPLAPKQHQQRDAEISLRKTKAPRPPRPPKALATLQKSHLRWALIGPCAGIGLIFIIILLWLMVGAAFGPSFTGTLRGHTDYVTSVSFSPDGKYIASASLDHTVKVWDTAEGTELLSLKGHIHWVRSVAFSPDGKRLASASDDDTAKVWDADKGQELLSFTGHTSGVTCVAFSPDGKRLASGSWDKTVKVWDADKGQEILTLKGHTNKVTSVAYSPDGKRIASASFDQTVKVWDADKGIEVLTLKGHTKAIGSVAYSPDGKRLASASDDNTVKVWDADKGQEFLSLKGHTSYVHSVAFSPDGARLASASLDNTVKVWYAANGQELLTLKGHTNSVTSVAYSPDGKRLASASWDNTVRVWDADKGQ
jgi:WD40 repeat protein